MIQFHHHDVSLLVSLSSRYLVSHFQQVDAASEMKRYSDNQDNSQLDVFGIRVLSSAEAPQENTNKVDQFAYESTSAKLGQRRKAAVSN